MGESILSATSRGCQLRNGRQAAFTFGAALIFVVDLVLENRAGLLKIDAVMSR